MAQWLCRRFERLFRQPSPPSDLGRFALPAEIISMITSHLDGLSTTFLAFTCRDLYSLCTPGQLVLTAAERTQLLQYLEDNIADAYFCRYCGTLHRWHGYWSHSILRWISEHTPRQHGRDDIYFSPFIQIPFSHAHLVMKRHFRGCEHGPLPNFLDKQTHTEYHRNGVKQSSARHARIVYDQLLVKTKIIISQRERDSKSLRENIKHTCRPICWHLYASRDPLLTQSPKLAIQADTPEASPLSDDSTRSCPICHTDYSINVSWQGQSEGYVVEICIYSQLGSCRSPLDWSWLTMACPRTDERFRVELDERFGPGSVRRLWHEADGHPVLPDAKWIDMFEELRVMFRRRGMGLHQSFSSDHPAIRLRDRSYGYNYAYELWNRPLSWHIPRK
jgi:hypothetical protein